MTNREKFKEIFGYEANMNECPIYCHTTDGDKCPCYKNKCYSGKWWNAEYKEPTAKNDLGVDCISRAEAIKCLECDFDITGKENMKTVVNYINSAHDKIVNLPRVKQEPRKGHWIKTGDYYTGAYGSIEYVECSCCHEDSLEEGDFCPNCGAKMVESEGTE